MKAKPDYYEFAGVRLFVNKLLVEITDTGAKHDISKNHWRFLLELAKNAPKVISYERLWKNVWNLEHFDDTSKHNIHTTKGQMVEWLKSIGIKKPPISVIPGKGYFLSCKVDRGYINNSIDTTGENKEKVGNNKHFLSFIVLISLFYGLQFLIVAFLEIAYQFERFWNKAVFWGLVFWILNSFCLFAALILISNRLELKRKITVPGILTLVTGGVLTILLAINLLPLQPVTQSDYQTQPAFIAFSKNILIYIIPLTTLFILLPYSIICAKNLVRNKTLRSIPTEIIVIKPRICFLVWGGMFIFSLLTTNFMLDRLNAESENHWIFVGLIFLRMIFYFGVPLASLIWYQIKTSELKGEI